MIFKVGQKIQIVKPNDELKKRKFDKHIGIVVHAKNQDEIIIHDSTDISHNKTFEYNGQVLNALDYYFHSKELILGNKNKRLN